MLLFTVIFMFFSYDDFCNGQQYVSYYVHSCIPTTVYKYTAAFCRMQHIHMWLHISEK